MIALFRDTPLVYICRKWSNGQMAINGQIWSKWTFMSIWPSDHVAPVEFQKLVFFRPLTVSCYSLLNSGYLSLKLGSFRVASRVLACQLEPNIYIWYILANVAKTVAFLSFQFCDKEATLEMSKRQP